MSTSAKSEYTKWMNTMQSKVIISLAPSTIEFQAARAEYEALTGTDNPYNNKELFDSIMERYYKKQIHENISLHQAQVIAEPIRIANPDQCVSLYTDGNSFIGNTSWADQMKHFFEYETFTPEGTALAKARQAEAKQLGIIASWE